MKATKDNYIELVHEVVRHCPRGRVTTYGAIADFLSLGASRMVGWALHHCPPDVPAHRVVNRKGELSGRNNFASPTLMQTMLEAEGVVVVNDTVVNFKELFWPPEEGF